FPQDEQPLDYVVNSFMIPFPLAAGEQMDPTTGDGPIGSADPRRSEFSNLGRLGRVSPASLIYLTEAHANMPLPGNANWAVQTDIFNPEQMARARRPRISNEGRHPRGITATFFDSHAGMLRAAMVDPGPGYSIYDRIRRFTYVEDEP